MITVYGISNCDTVRKARRWLDEHELEYRFIDLRKQGLDTEELDAWISAQGWESLLNRRGTTWRKLPETDRADVDEQKAKSLMLNQVSLIKRPIVRIGSSGPVILGFDPQDWEMVFDV